jgi:hypothetical protein
MNRVVRPLLSAILVLVTCSASAARPDSPVAGDWIGTLDAGVKLRLAFHLKIGDEGKLTATLDSPDQGATGIPIETATFVDGTLRLELPALHASFDGRLDEAAHKIAGTWTQGGASLPLVLMRQTEAPPEKTPAAGAERSDAIRPTWTCAIDTGGSPLTLSLHLSRGDDGVLSATVDSPDQGATGLPVARAVYRGRKLVLEMPALDARYEATMSDDGTELRGTWSQHGATLPLTLKAVDELPSVRRPKEP